MKIDYKKYPFLERFEKRNTNKSLLFGGNLMQTPLRLLPHIQQNKTVLDRISRAMKKVLTHNSINCVSLPVMQIFDEDFNVADKLWSIRDEIQDTVAVLLCPKGEMYFYQIMTVCNEVTVICWHFVDRVFDAFTVISWKKGSFYQECSVSHDSFMVALDGSLLAIDDPRITYLTQMVVTFELFKKYAELETKVVSKTNGTRAKVAKQKYKNNCKVPITIIDSTWFTRIVRSEEFNVKGHFRLQAYGEGMNDRKLIWVNGFKKHGYTRKAKIESI